MDTRFPTDPKVVELAEQFGGTGPMTMVALFCACKNHGTADGRVKDTYKAFAPLAYCSPAKVKRILAAADEIGLIEAENLGERGFMVRLPAWHRWQEAFRQGQRRAQAKTYGNVEKRTPTVTGTETETGTVAIKEEVGRGAVA